MNHRRGQSGGNETEAVSSVVHLLWRILLLLVVVLVPLQHLTLTWSSIWFRDPPPGEVSANRIVVSTQVCTCPDWAVLEAPAGFPDEVSSTGLHPSDDFWDLPSSYGDYIFEGELVDVPPSDTRPWGPVFRVDRYYPRDRGQFDLLWTNIGVRVYVSWAIWLVALVFIVLLNPWRRSKRIR